MKKLITMLSASIALSVILVACSQPAQQVPMPSNLHSAPFAMKDVKVTQHQFKHAEQIEAEYLLELDADRLLSGFLSEAGLTPKAPKYEGWESLGVAGQTLGHYVSALSMYYATSKDERYNERLSYIIDEFERCQIAHGNGYLAATPDGKRIFSEVAAGNVKSQGFDLNGGWVPMYVMHKVLAGLIDAYQFAGNQKALEVATKLGDWIVNTFGSLSEENMQRVLACEFGGMNESLANLYAITHKDSFLRLAHRFDNHKAVMDSLSVQIDNLEGLHANTQVPKIVGAARLYELTGNSRDSIIATFFWETLVNNHTYVNGGNSDGEHLGLPGKLNDRLGTSTTETCNTYNMLKLTRHLFGWKPDAAYSDYYEKAMYNHILASQNPDDGMCTYYTPLVSGSKKGYLSKFSSFCCCSGSGMENHMKYGDFIYSQGADSSLFVNLFVASELNWDSQGIKVVQEGNLPVTNTARFILSMDEPRNTTIRVRHPHWSPSVKVKINGKRQKVNSQPSSYFSLQREWRDGDVMEVVFEPGLYGVAMPDNPHRIGIFYGPLLLSGEMGTEEPDIAKDIPVLVTDGRPVSEWVSKVSNDPLQFKTKNVGDPKDISLIPFYAMHHQYYVVYWDLFTKAEWEKSQQAYQNELKRLQELDRITVDYISLGEMQPERDHQLRGDGIGNGMFNKKKWRAAWTKGWFSFNLKVCPDETNNLIVTYWGGETPEKEFDILIDDKVLVREKIYLNRPGDFFEQIYPLPASLTKGKEQVTVMFRSTETNWTGAVYNARIIKQKAN